MIYSIMNKREIPLLIINVLDLSIKFNPTLNTLQQTNMPQECNICWFVKDKSEFSLLKRNNGVRLAKSCWEWN